MTAGIPSGVEIKLDDTNTKLLISSDYIDSFAWDSTGFGNDARANADSTRKAFRVNYYDGTQTEADANLISETDDWTSNHKLQGIAYISVRLEFNREVWSKVPVPRVLLRGKKLYDPRTGIQAWSDNSALVIRDYLTSSDGFGVSDSKLPDSNWVAAANLCEESVQETLTQTNNRYTINGVVSLASQHSDVIEQMKTSIGNQEGLIYTAGTYELYPGKYESPTYSITADDLRGPVGVQPRAKRADLFNAVKGTYVDTTSLYSPTEYPFVTNETYEAEDGDEQIFLDIEMPYTVDPITAQRLAKLHLEVSRSSQVVIFPCKFSGLNTKLGQTISLTVSQLGYTGKVFKIIGWQLVKDGVDLVLREESSTAYDWSTSDAGTPLVGAAPPVINPARLPEISTGAGGLVQLDENADLPAVGGDNLTGIILSADLGVTAQEFFTDATNITTGASDSGGSGYKLLRVPNSETLP